MSKFFHILFVGITLCTATRAQSQDPKAVRVINKETPVYETSKSNSRQTLRIERGKFWINGNLIPEESLPQSLRNIPDEYLMETTLFGLSEFQFNLNGRDYLLKHGKVIELPGAPSKAGMEEEQLKTEFFRDVKNDSPDLFSRQIREAELYQRCTLLLLDYQQASENDRSQIRKELFEALSQLFDISLSNQAEEIRQVENEIEMVKKELEFRRRSKDLILQNRMKELLQE
ncbi:MAG: hypothetical protein H6581_02200 [Bacteroidia bacterium]|nr:hypothetical protein [Bacteroidia bacterium]